MKGTSQAPFEIFLWAVGFLCGTKAATAASISSDVAFSLMWARARIIGSASPESTSKTGVPHFLLISRNNNLRSAVGTESPMITRSKCSSVSSSNARVVLVAGETAYPAWASVPFRATPVRLSNEIDKMRGKDKTAPS
ncbi:MAG: hypothetical protein JWO20_3102 [Candidatus Angelobacter sp.]|nr:hypothetical protein [Candidatus Angelobacter sp.]